MPKRWLVKRRWLVVLEATTYTRIYGQQQLGKCWCVAGNQPTWLTGKKFVVKLYLCKYFCTFSVCKNVSQRKKVYCDSTPNIPIYMYCNSSYMYIDQQKLTLFQLYCTFLTPTVYCIGFIKHTEVSLDSWVYGEVSQCSGCRPHYCIMTVVQKISNHMETIGSPDNVTRINCPL